MDRRRFHKALGLGVLGIGGAGVIRPLEAMARPPVPGLRRGPADDHRAWARENFRGMENLLLPSFSPEFGELDEEGLRVDVRQSARQGFFSTMPVGLGLSADERRRMLEIVADEARGKILVTASAGGSAESLRHAEASGASQVFMSLDRDAATEDDVFTSARRTIEATDLGVVVYGRPNEAFRKFHPSGLPLGALDRIADLPNVIAIKFTQVMSLATAFELADCVGDRLLLGPVHLDAVPLLATRYHVQWSGQWTVESIQSPEQPRAVQFMELVGEGRTEEALQKYWELQPAYEAFYDLQAPPLRLGGHPWSHQKYYQWLTGGNGGLLRDLGASEAEIPPLDRAGRQAIREIFAASDIDTVELPDEAFVVGRAAYERGVRRGDLKETPQYAD